MCGAVKFNLTEAPHRMMNCHCSMCRRQGGGPFITWAAFDDEAIRIEQGADLLKTIKSSSFAYQTFCQVCGSTISLNYYSQTGTTWLAGGGIEDDPGCCPDSHIMLNYKAPWHDLTENVLHRFP